MFKHVIPAALCSALTALAEPVETTVLSDARVNIPYHELKALLQAANQETQKPQPPVKSSLQQANYVFSVSGNQINAVAEFQVHSFTEEWTVIPLLETAVHVQSIEPADTRLIVQDQHYALVTNKPGAQTVKLHFTAALTGSERDLSLHLPIARASISRLHITGLKEEQEVMVEGAAKHETPDGDFIFHFASSNSIQLQLQLKSREEMQPAIWTAESAAIVEFQESRLHYRALITLNAASGSAADVELQFPAAAKITRVAGNEVERWSSTMDAKHRVLKINCRTPQLLGRQFEIDYQMPQPAMAAEWALHSPQIIHGKNMPALFAVIMDAGLELTANGSGSPPRQLPKWLADQLAKRNHLTVAGDAKINARWLPLVETAEAIIEKADAKMQVVTDGALFNEISYSIRHDRPYAWQLQLPPGSELLSCFVNGAQTNPVNRGDHRIEVALTGSKQSSEVKLVYTGRKPAFDPVSGQVELDLPSTSLLIHRMQWQLAIPAAYEVSALQGNAEPVPCNEKNETARIIRLRKELCKGERPFVQLFYQKPSVIK
jgi:hypothetical protein